MIIVDCNQNSDEWFDLRLGNPWASSVHKIITPSGQPSKQSQAYMDRLFDQIISGERRESWYNEDMARGHEREQESIDQWQFENDTEIERVGIVFKDDKKLFHCSPDGIIPSMKMGFETKDALPHIQRERLKSNKIEGPHWIQCQMSIFVCDYDAWIYQSYCRNMPTLTVKLEPDTQFIMKLESALYKFCGELNKMVKEYKK